VNTEKTFVRYWVIIPAAGSGQRMQADCPKQYLKIQNKTVLEHTLSVFEHPNTISGIVLSLAEEDPLWPSVKQGLANYALPLYESQGGEERCHSVFNAMTELQKYAQAQDWVLVHDAARPCVSWSDIQKLIDELKNDAVGGLLASPVKDTIKQSNLEGHVASTVDRSHLWRALTPQMFRFELLYTALQLALEKKLWVTDDAPAIEQLGHKPKLIEGSSDNIKITTPEDLVLAELYLAR